MVEWFAGGIPKGELLSAGCRFNKLLNFHVNLSNPHIPLNSLNSLNSLNPLNPINLINLINLINSLQVTEIKSDTVTIRRSAENLFHFLSDLNNFGKLMPEQVINWQSTKDACSFTIKGMADVSLVISEKRPNSFLKYNSGAKSPFAFSILSNINEEEMNRASVVLVLSADLSPMLKIMAERPLQNFVNLLAVKLKEVAESEIDL